MVGLQAMINSNCRLSAVTGPHVALFVGATSGIGLAVLKEFARQAGEPRIYFVARNPTAAASIVEELRILNPRAKFEIIERNVSLIKDAEEVAEFVKAKEPSLDLLFMSVGFFSLDGRKGDLPIKTLRLHCELYSSVALDTTEGLDASMTTRYYSRIRITQLLLPLLNKSPSPHVMSVLAAGREGPIHEDDLALTKIKNFTVSSANSHCATMMTLMLEGFAAENPRISFVHAFPGIVATPLFDRISSGFLGMVIRYLGAPVLRLFAKSVSDAGQWGLFTATSARYSVDSGIVPLAGDMTKAERSKGGIFLLNEHGETVDNEKVLEDFRKREVNKNVWDHTIEVFAGIR